MPGPDRGPARACRPFGIGDGMMLVAATAGAAGYLRATREAFGKSSEYRLDVRSGSVVDFLDWFSWGARWSGSAVLIAGTLAYLGFRLRRPRPGRRRLARQPGAVACLAAVAVWLPIVPALRYEKARELSVDYPLDFVMHTPTYSGPAVAGAWLTLGVSGRWRREPGWVDGLGIGLGAAWLALSLVSLLQLL